MFVTFLENFQLEFCELIANKNYAQANNPNKIVKNEPKDL